jgi:DNA modification methylase
MPKIGSQYRLYCGDCLDVLLKTSRADTLFADPPDNLKLKYATFIDDTNPIQYVAMMRKWLEMFLRRAKTVWLSYNAAWAFDVGRIVTDLLAENEGLKAKPCCQVYTFGQNSQSDLYDGFRPLLRLQWPDAMLFPDAVRIPSWRQVNGDKRADPRGRLPSNVFDFPRVTGNSKQRRAWSPTQLHEGLVERCIKLTTPPGGTVLDVFSGSATTLRVCKRLNVSCTSIEIDHECCKHIAKEHNLSILTVT